MRINKKPTLSIIKGEKLFNYVTIDKKQGIEEDYVKKIYLLGFPIFTLAYQKDKVIINILGIPFMYNNNGITKEFAIFGIKFRVTNRSKYLKQEIFKIQQALKNITNTVNIEGIIVSSTNLKSAIELWYRSKTGHILHLDNPKTFNEKIQWLKLYDSTPIKTKLADKYLVRDWVKEKIGEKYLIPLLGVYDNFKDINFDELPNQFVIKCNHGSGYNIIVKDKSQLDLTYVENEINKWMRENFAYRVGYEMHYRDIEPKILIEKYLSNDGKALWDYKFWCFDGNVLYMQFRDDFSQDLKMVFYDMNWNKQPFYYSHPIYDKELKKPDNFNEMIEISKKLCQGFSFVCVDLYRLNNGEIKFGEMTFTRSSGIGRWNSEEYNKKLGDLIKLPSKIYNLDTREFQNRTGDD